MFKLTWRYNNESPFDMFRLFKTKEKALEHWEKELEPAAAILVSLRDLDEEVNLNA